MKNNFDFIQTLINASKKTIETDIENNHTISDTISKNILRENTNVSNGARLNQRNIENLSKLLEQNNQKISTTLKMIESLSTLIKEIEKQ